MRADSDSSAGQRRSQRQRIDLSIGEEGFDRHELERALRASLDEEKIREKESPNKKKTPGRAKPDKKSITSPPLKHRKSDKSPVSAVTKKSPPTKRKRKGAESDSEGEEEEIIKEEAKSPPSKKVAKKELKKSPATKVVSPAAVPPTAKAPTVPKKGAEPKKEVKKEIKEVKKEIKEEKKTPVKQAASKSVKSPKPKQLPKSPPTSGRLPKSPPTSGRGKSTRDPGLGKRVAHTQASDFITLLACATKVLGGTDRTSDYVL